MAIVIVNKHEPEHEVGARLLELAEEKDLDVRSVEAVRGEHDAALSFRVPDEVGSAFEKDRAKRWPDKIENDGEDVAEPASVDGDAVAATNNQIATEARVDNTEETTARTEETTTPSRKARSGNARE